MKCGFCNKTISTPETQLVMTVYGYFVMLACPSCKAIVGAVRHQD